MLKPEAQAKVKEILKLLQNCLVSDDFTNEQKAELLNVAINLIGLSMSL